MTTVGAVRPYRELLPNGEMRHNMHYGQIAVMMSKAREILALAGTQSGKTACAVDWMEREINVRGEGDYLMVSATYPLMQLKLLPEFLDVFQHMEHKGKYRDSDKVFEFTQGKTRVIFGTATNPESLESATAKAAVADEAGQKQFRREAREALLRRLSLHQGRILYPSTPYQLGWLKTELFDRAKLPGSGIEVITWPSTANPAFPVEEFERAKQTMPLWKFRMFYEGKFERPAGLVYDSFDESACKIRRFPIPGEWPHYVWHDFGTANPAAMFYAQDPATGYFYAYGEYKPGPGRSTREHVEEFKRLTEGMNVVKRAGGSHQEEEIREAYRAHGWYIQEPKLNHIEAQIDRVYALHKLNKLFVFDDVQKYLDEKLSFSYLLDDKYEPTDKYEDESSMHLLAAERYILSDFTPEMVEGDSQLFTMKRHGFGDEKRRSTHFRPLRRYPVAGGWPR
mgnify:FL=1